MNTLRWIGVIVLVFGLLGLGYDSFSFTKATRAAKIGPLELSLQEKQTFSVPVWASGAAIAIGLVLLVIGGGTKR
ncbi:MAG: hypothetical protein H6R19_394 [Proteobacteria bacterium]|nr:hypothetical protein [Pseudomonadota bacterium]